MKRYCLALDLKNEPALIREYLRLHKQVWPEVLASIRASGISGMEIYHTGNRLFMILEVEDDFSFQRKQEMDNSNPKVAEWEAMMWKFQQAIPGSVPGEKWRLMERIFNLNDPIGRQP